MSASENGHTPGPWTLEFETDGSGEWVIRSARGHAMMGNATYYPWQSSNVHDARLIAAAPEMLEALKAVMEEKAPRYHDCTDDGLPKCAWCLAEEAISKAEGGAA